MGKIIIQVSDIQSLLDYRKSRNKRSSIQATDHKMLGRLDAFFQSVLRQHNNNPDYILKLDEVCELLPVLLNNPTATLRTKSSDQIKSNYNLLRVDENISAGLSDPLQRQVNHLLTSRIVEASNDNMITGGLQYYARVDSSYILHRASQEFLHMLAYLSEARANLLTPKNLSIIMSHQHICGRFARILKIFVLNNPALITQSNLNVLLEHPEIANVWVGFKIATGNGGELTQERFETILLEKGSSSREYVMAMLKKAGLNSQIIIDVIDRGTGGTSFIKLLSYLGKLNIKLVTLINIENLSMMNIELNYFIRLLELFIFDKLQPLMTQEFFDALLNLQSGEFIDFVTCIECLRDNRYLTAENVELVFSKLIRGTDLVSGLKPLNAILISVGKHIGSQNVLEMLVSRTDLDVFEEMLAGLWYLFFKMDEENLRLLVIRKNLPLLEKILVISANGKTKPDQAQLCLIIAHQQLNAIYRVLRISPEFMRDAWSFGKLLRHKDPVPLEKALRRLSHAGASIRIPSNTNAILDASDPIDEVKRIIAWHTKGLNWMIVPYVDAAKRFVTENMTPEEQEKRQAALLITRVAREHLHHAMLSRSGHTLFKNKKHDTRRNRAIGFPEKFKHLAALNVPPVFQTTSHTSKNGLSAILHDGRIYPNSISGKAGLGGFDENIWGDCMLVCTSPSMSSDYGIDHRIVMFVDKMLARDSGNSPGTVFFKFIDWVYLASQSSSDYFDIAPHLSVRIRIAGGSSMVWDFQGEGALFETVEIPNEECIYHGYDGLNEYLTFFIFRVLKQLPDNLRLPIYEHFQSLKDTDLINTLQSMMRAVLEYPELDFNGSLRLSFDMIKSISLNEYLVIDFDELRLKIEGDDTAYFETLLSNLDFKELFQKSYFIVQGILDYAKTHRAINVTVYILGSFKNTLNVRKQVDLQKRLQHQTSRGHRRNGRTFSLTNPDQPSELGRLSVTPSQINNLVVSLASQRSEIVRYLNDNREKVKIVTLLCLIAFREFNDVSDLGLKATLRKCTVQSQNFQPLLMNKENCRILLYLSSLGNDYDSVDSSLHNFIRVPLFVANNRYTGTKLMVYFSGMKNSNSEGINDSLLADILFNVPLPSIYVPNNGSSFSQLVSGSELAEQAGCYRLLFKILRALAVEHKIELGLKTKDEEALSEAYDYKKWPEYRKRFLLLAADLPKYDISDGCGKRLRGLTAEAVIKRGLVLTSGFSHFCLDTKHLQSILTSNYGDFKSEFYRLLNKMVNSSKKDRPDCSHKVTGIQLFYRLQLLEYELVKDQGVKPGRFVGLSC